MTPPLAELHLHLYGCLPPEPLLGQLLQHEPHLELRRYEESYEQAYGTPTPLREVLDRCRAGDPAGPGRFSSLFVFGEEDAGNFARFQAKFNLILAASAFTFGPRLGAATGRPPASLLAEEVERFTAAICREQARQGIAYAEQRMLLGAPGDWDWALPAMRAGQRAAPLQMRVAASLPREDPWPQWERVSALAAGTGGELLTAVDFCFIEEGHPPKDKAAFFQAVREHNGRHPARALAILYHVGESFTDKSLEGAVRWVQEAAELGAHRLGHAIALGVEPLSFLRPGVAGTADGRHEREERAAERMDQLRYDLRHAEGLERHGVRIDRAAAAAELERLGRGPASAPVRHVYDVERLTELRRRQDYAMGEVRRAGAVIEVCPTSNRRIGGLGDDRHHPVHRFLAAGLRVVVSSDDPGIFGTTLGDELDWVARVTGIGEEGRAGLLREAWTARSEALTGREAPSAGPPPG